MNKYDFNYLKNNYSNILITINNKLEKLEKIDNHEKYQEYTLEIIYDLKKFVDSIDLKVYILIGTKKDIPDKIYYNSLFMLGSLYKNYVEKELNIQKTLSTELIHFYNTGLNYFLTILQFKINDKPSLDQIISIYSHLTSISTDINTGIIYMKSALLYDAINPIVHYNIAFLYFKLNNLEEACIHFKISIGILEKLNSNDIQLLNKCYFQIVLINRLINNFGEALYYLLKGIKLEPNNPDLNNQLGIVYTEMRRTDLAKRSYETGIKHYKTTYISDNINVLLSDLYINYGHMNAYNGSINDSIIYYNKALKVRPDYYITVNNKCMNLTYLFDKYEDKLFLTNEHKKINNIFPKINNYTFDSDYFKTQKINIGIVSGDFVNHPVSYFISTFLKNFNSDKFNVICYVEAQRFDNVFNDKIQFKIIKQNSTQDVCTLIYNDNIHILFDLSGHTAFNRLDVFAQKPTPIQISYLGYPFTTGLNTMDYRITDAICDGDLTISKKYYTEKLIRLPNCFLCYDPINYSSNGKLPNGKENNYKIPEITNDLSNDYINIGCFNRLNKINDKYIELINEILLTYKKIKIFFKTKALMNKTVKYNFLHKFDITTHNRIILMDCTISHDEHLLEYNKVHFAIDTFPYSGTTTTCEALLMGVPVFSFYDDKYYYHPQNVSCSILKNSNLDKYIITNSNNIIDRISELMNVKDWLKFKTEIRNNFLNGFVCNKKIYMNNLENLLNQMYNKHKC